MEILNGILRTSKIHYHLGTEDKKTWYMFVLPFFEVHVLTTLTSICNCSNNGALPLFGLSLKCQYVLSQIYESF